MYYGDTKDPRFEVGPGLKGVKRAKGFGDGFLNEIFRLAMVPAKPESVAVERR